MTYVCPNHTPTHGYTPSRACGGWAPGDPDHGRQCTEAELRQVDDDELIDLSSLGDPEAKAAREATPPEITEELLRRINEANAQHQGGKPYNQEDDT